VRIDQQAAGKQHDLRLAVQHRLDVAANGGGISQLGY
jgi:hypothetical protein